MKVAKSTKIERINENIEETHTHLKIINAADAEIVQTDTSPKTDTNGRVPLQKTKPVQVLNTAMAKATKIPMPKNVDRALNYLKTNAE